MNPLMFNRPAELQVDTVPLETHNKVVAELDATTNELIRCRQKVAHLLEEIKELRGT